MKKLDRLMRGCEKNVHLRKIWMTMKLTMFLLFLSIAQIMAAGAYSQTTRISLQFKDVAVKQVLNQIEESSEFFFLYNSKLVDVDRKVDIDVKDERIDEILNDVFRETNVAYTVVDRQIVLTNKADLGGFLQQSSQQPAKTVSGIVRDKSGQPIPGASIVVKGTTTGVSSSTNGGFSVPVPANAKVVIVTFVGMKPQEVVLGTNNQIDVVLEEEAASLDEVVVTALGIKREAKSLTYSTQKIAGTELTNVPETNLMNTLSGKVAGISVQRSETGLGGSVKVVLRGNKSIFGENQPLYIIDGVPMQNFSKSLSNGDAFGNGTDYGDAISNINPNDIESINILKGASAAALYGSSAANGVILITTKRGVSGITRIDISSSTTMDQATFIPKFQTKYGASTEMGQDMWGAALTSVAYDKNDQVRDFFKTGVTSINHISLSSGTDKIATYFSYSNTSGTGIMPNHQLHRNNISFRESAKFLDNKLTLEGRGNYITETNFNPPGLGYSFTPLSGLYQFPTNQDITPYKDNFEKFDPIRNINVQNWWTTSPNQQNPYWLRNRVIRQSKTNRLLLNFSAKYEFNSWLNLLVRSNIDRAENTTEEKFNASTINIAGPNGHYLLQHQIPQTVYADALLNFNRSFGNFNLNGLLGASYSDVKTSSDGASSNSLFIPNVFITSNFILKGLTSLSSAQNAHTQLQAAFASFSGSYKDWLYLDITGRNDWSSALSYTPNVSFFYPSFGGSAILSQALNLPEFISFAKLKGSFAIVGNTVPAFVTNPVNSVANGSVIYNTIAPFSDLKPEKTHSFEVGTELRLFKNLVSLDLTYYKTDSYNQFFNVQVPAGTGYSYRYFNGGDIRNSGFEATIDLRLTPAKDLKWNSSLNFTANKNKIISLANNVSQFFLSQDSNGTYTSILKEGGQYGDLFNQTWARDDQGRILIDPETKTMIPSSESYSYLGTINPDFKLGWNNNFNYNNFSFNFLIDGSFGGIVVGGITGGLEAAADRDRGYTIVNAVVKGTNETVTQMDPYKYWHQAIPVGEYKYDATTVRMREIGLGYTLPKNLLKGSASIKVSVVARNLFYLLKYAPYDPEMTYSIGNGFQGYNNDGMPPTRSIGMNLNLSF